jgi:DNA-nicking Smr family endonuclease
MQTEWTMAWKKDLAKLKQDLGKEEGLPAKSSPPPKAKPVHPVSQSIEEEDTIFLNAMGLRPKPAEREPSAAPPPAPLKPAAPAAGGKVEFSEAMGDLKGMKPLKQAPVQAKPPVKTPAPQAAAAPAPPAPEASAPVPEPAAEPLPAQPEAAAGPSQAQIHLAAGMAIVVDGSLDLKGHARSDAEERLKERILDGYALGWRTLHVVVGSSEELRAMVLDLLKSPSGRCVARYAQAPVPMGGPQAWILYFHGPGALEN